MLGDFEGAGVHTVRGVRDGSIGPIAALISNTFEILEINATYNEIPPG